MRGGKSIFWKTGTAQDMGTPFSPIQSYLSSSILSILCCSFICILRCPMVVLYSETCLVHLYTCMLAFLLPLQTVFIRRSGCGSQIWGMNLVSLMLV